MHAALNLTTLTLFSASLLVRRRGARRAGVALGLLGSGVASASAYLGGHLVYRRGLGVDHSGFEADEQTAEWSEACAETDLKDGTPKAVSVNGIEVMLLKQGDTIHALANQCNHAGGPLAEGEIAEGSVTCPWHGSRFSLEDGRVLRGPAAQPQQAFQARVINGAVQIRSI